MADLRKEERRYGPEESSPCFLFSSGNPSLSHKITESLLLNTATTGIDWQIIKNDKEKHSTRDG